MKPSFLHIPTMPIERLISASPISHLPSFSIANANGYSVTET